jgi:hypothetical protein
MLQVRVEFDLVDRRRDPRRLEDDVEVFRVVVAHADGPRQTLRLQLLHLSPAGLVFGFVLCVEGAVDEVAFLFRREVMVSLRSRRVVVVIVIVGWGNDTRTDLHGRPGAFADST